LPLNLHNLAIHKNTVSIFAILMLLLRLNPHLGFYTMGLEEADFRARRKHCWSATERRLDGPF
jgi:hypothetical protein